MNNKLVSIIVPTYNGEKFIAQTLEAIIDQDYDNLEIIVVDDVSTDNTVEIAQKILEGSGRKFQLIRRTVNGMQSAARNTGLDAANGEYVIFFDHDDLAEKNFVLSLYSKAEKENADFVFCPFKKFFQSEDRYENPKFVDINKNFFSGEYCLRLWIKKKIAFRGVWNCIFRKSFLNGINLRFNENCFFGEDEEFLIKAMISASRVGFDRETSYTYVQHSGQTLAKYEAIEKQLMPMGHLMLANFRTGRYIRKYSDCEKRKQYAKNFLVPDSIVKMITVYARSESLEEYQRKLKVLNHKKVHALLLSTRKFIFKKPELFFKALMILYVPNLYYKIRHRRQSSNKN